MIHPVIISQHRLKASPSASGTRAEEALLQTVKAMRLLLPQVEELLRAKSPSTDCEQVSVATTVEEVTRLPKEAFEGVSVPRQMLLAEVQEPEKQQSPYTYEEDGLAWRIARRVLYRGDMNANWTTDEVNELYDSNKSEFLYAARKACEQSVVPPDKYGTAFYLMLDRDAQGAEEFHELWLNGSGDSMCPIKVCKNFFQVSKDIGREFGHVEDRLGKAFFDWQSGRRYTYSRMFSRAHIYGQRFLLEL